MTDERGTANGEDGDGPGTSAERATAARPLIDGVFEVLADWRRREVCRFFVETAAETATVDELALLVAGCRPASVPTVRPHEGVVADLRAEHLPLMSSVGVVDYDERSGTVRYRGQPTVEKWLEHVSAVDRRGD